MKFMSITARQDRVREVKKQASELVEKREEMMDTISTTDYDSPQKRNRDMMILGLLAEEAETFRMMANKLERMLP